MFDQITLILITESTNGNAERLETEREMAVQATAQKISRAQRDLYGERGLGRAVRFKIALLGNYYEDDIPYFMHNGIKYSTQDFTKDVTGSSYYIEGVTVRGTI